MFGYSSIAGSICLVRCGKQKDSRINSYKISIQSDIKNNNNNEEFN